MAVAGRDGGVVELRRRHDAEARALEVRVTRAASPAADPARGMQRPALRRAGVVPLVSELKQRRRRLWERGKKITRA
jgi:hypothetical protein